MTNADPSKLTSLISLLITSFELIGTAIKYGGKVKRGFSNEGIYKVLVYQSSLEILGSSGKHAIFKKKMVIKYLQDNVNTFTDFGWSDGKGLLNYQVSPGHPVDQYKSGHREYVLISLRKRKRRGEINNFRMQWDIQDGFLKPSAYWQTDVTHHFSRMVINVILPKNRPPRNCYVEEINTKKIHDVQAATMEL